MLDTSIHYLLNTYIKKIIDSINFTFVKRGDGEIECMRGDIGSNCDGHPYTKDLGDKLIKAFEFLKDKAYIAEFSDQVNYNIFLHRRDNDLEKLREFWMTVKDSPRRKIFIGPMRLEGAVKMLGIGDFIVVPLSDAFSFLKTLPLPKPEKDDIWILSCGMSARWIIHTLLEQNREITCIDAGSSFDPVLSHRSRTGQADKETLRRLYLPRPSQEELNKMFCIPPDKHPEKLFKLERISNDDKVIYDLGCSTFKTLDRAIGVDIEKKEGVDLIASVDELPMVNSNSVDVILASHIIEHIADTEKVLKEWHRILKVGGRIIFLIPDDGAIDTLNPIMNGTGAQRHLHTFTRQAFKDIVDKFNGLDIIENVTVMEGWSFGGVITKS